MSRSPNPPLFNPQPRRPGTFSLTPISTDSTGNSDQSPLDGNSEPSTPDVRESNYDGYGGLSREQSRDSLDPPKKSRSILNLTSSTLFGIYNHSGFDSSRDEPPTPFGTGALTPAPGTGSQTPARSASIDIRGTRGGPVFSEDLIREKAKISTERKRERRKSELQQQAAFWRKRSPTMRFLTHVLRTALLFSIGVAYGALIAHLHDKENIAPVRVEQINRRSRFYFIFWGSMGVALGSLLPWVDGLWQPSGTYMEDEDTDRFQDTSNFETDDEVDAADRQQSRLSLGAEWNPAVRSIGAFVGIAFAIRKLAWQSTLQVSLTLALVNPFLWYLIDRTRSGFVLATITGLAGSAILLTINPEWVPSPTMANQPSVSSPAPSVWGVLESITKPLAAQTAPEPLPEPSLLLNIVSYESVGVATWISSVLFCSCIFFGNIGRRLALE